MAVAIGAGWALLGLASLLLPLAARALGAASVGTDLGSALAGLVTHLLVGAAFVWVGVGSLRRRRWARPLMLTLAWAWLVGGALTLALLPALVDGVLGASTPPSPRATAAIKLSLLALASLPAVLLPAAFIWVYRDRDVIRTCERHDPTLSWTERCPTSVLGWSVGLGASAALVLPALVRPAVPLFGRLVGGWAGAALLLAAAAALLLLARACFRLSPVGWWGSLVALVALGASTTITFLRVEPTEALRRLGYPADQVELLGGLLDGRSVAGASAVLTAATVLYLVAIRRHFRRAEDGAAAPGARARP